MPIKRYHLGCPVWNESRWVGEFYSDDAKKQDFLREYSSVFNAVEGNSTFYGLPAPSTIEKWGDSVADGFKFCFKMPKVITHQKRLRKADEDVKRFIERIEPIYRHIGPIMIQLSAGFGPDQLDQLEVFMSKLPSKYTYGVEVRHRELHDNGKHENRLNRILQSFQANRIIFDTRRLHATKSRDPDITAIQQRKPHLPVRFKTTASRPIVRFVGSNDVPNNVPYLKEWAIIAAEWIREGLHPYIFIHAPNEFYAPRIARKFHILLADLVDLESMPRWPAEKRGQDGQMSLF